MNGDVHVEEGTPFADKVSILTDLYMGFSDDGAWHEWIRSQHLGVSMAVLIYNGAAIPTEVGISLVEKAWNALLDRLSVPLDSRWDDLFRLLTAAGWDT